MEYLKAILIGIIQGLTEFLPVSSSGHIVIFQEILRFDIEPENNLVLIVILHLATALSTVVVFRKEISRILRHMFITGRGEKTYALYILISMLPAMIAGLILKELIESFVENLYVVAASLAATALLLLLAGWLKKRSNLEREITFTTAIVMGLSQATAALLPGLSRSGSTIASALLIGTDKEKATQFSFLMVLPLILGVSAKMVWETIQNPLTETIPMDYTLLSVSFIAAFLSGIVACRWMIKLVKKAKLYYFSLYCGAVSAGILLYLYIN